MEEQADLGAAVTPRVLETQVVGTEFARWVGERRKDRWTDGDAGLDADGEPPEGEGNVQSG